MCVGVHALYVCVYACVCIAPRLWLRPQVCVSVRVCVCVCVTQGQGTNYSFVGSTALHWCAAKGHLACLRWLLGRGARVAQANSAGAYPLHAAVTHEHLDVIQVLILRAGADAQVRLQECLPNYTFWPHLPPPQAMPRPCMC